MDAEAELQLAEQLLGDELNHLESYNRMLERGCDPSLTDLVERFRDEEVVRVEEIQGRIRGCRSRLAASMERAPTDAKTAAGARNGRSRGPRHDGTGRA